MKRSDPPVIVEATYPRSLRDVWQAITDAEQMRQWYFPNIPDFKAAVGFETRFNIHNDGRDFLHIWKVTEVVPESSITYTWKFEGYDGFGYTTFELFATGEQTKLRLTNYVLEDYQTGIPEFKRESCEGGWQYFIGESLKQYLG